MSAGGGEHVATNSTEFCTADENGFIHFIVDDGTGTHFDARVHKNDLADTGGEETLLKIAATLAAHPDWIFQEDVPVADKIESKTPQTDITAGGILSLTNPEDFNAMRNGIAVEYEYFIYNPSNTNDHYQVDRNGVAVDVGWKLDETLDITEYGFTTANPPTIRVLAIGQNGLSNTNTLGIDDYNNIGYTMYPNPTRNVLNISANENIKSIEVFNMLGQKIENITNSNTSLSIDTSRYAAGMYSVIIKSEKGSTVKKFIKQ